MIFCLLPPPCLTTSGLTHSRGILGFVDHTGNLPFCTLGTMPQGEDIRHHSGVSCTPSSPLHSYFLFVYNIAKPLCSSKAWCIHTVPFFYNVSEQNEPRHWELGQSYKVLSMLDSWLEQETLRPEVLWSVVQKRVDFAEENQDVHFWELNFART